MPLMIQKYGGSSLATPAHILNVARRIIQTKEKGYQLVVVVSAMGQMTNDLLNLAHEITDTPYDRELDMLLSSGERVSMALLSMALHKLGHHSISFTGSQSGIVTDTAHTKAKILEIKADRIQKELHNGKIVIVAGFQGVSLDKEVTTLGRGGSDLTAVALAVHLKAERCEFYKDVDGVYTEDPKQNEKALKLKTCKIDEVMQLVQNGSRILNPDALLLAKENLLPLYLASSFNFQEGTTIHAG